MRVFSFSKSISLPKRKDDDRIFSIRYTLDGKLVEEKAGRAAAGMTAAKAYRLWRDSDRHSRRRIAGKVVKPIHSKEIRLEQFTDFYSKGKHAGCLDFFLGQR